MGKASAPPAPNYAPVAEANAKAAQLQYQLGQEQLDWGRQQFETVWPYAQTYLDQQLAASADSIENARQAQDFYETNYRPIEAEFAQTALNYNTPERAAQNAGAAMADVTNAFEGARKAALSTLESYGIDPSQTRFGALDMASRVQQAAATAAAGTNSRRATEATGLALQGEAINIGRGYPGSVAQAYGTATAAGKAGLGGANETTQTGGYTMGTPGSYFSGGNTAMGNQATAMHYGYQDSLAGAQFNAQQSANFSKGLGSLVGGALGLGFMPGGFFGY